jgi:small nuclear ribonucleoprotein (snRNP)-like protein
LEPKLQLKNVKASDNSTLRQVPPCFIETVKWHETGPYSLLYEALLNQQRIRVLVRYVNSIRGTLTGYVTAFDQHMNLLLRDVDEQYCPRRTTNEDQLNTKITHQDVESLSNAQAEVQRRIGCLSHARDDFGSHTSSQQQEQQQDSKGGTWMLRQRHMSQIMVRGDVIVLIYKASEERSAWSIQTNGSSIENTFTL